MNGLSHSLSMGVYVCKDNVKPFAQLVNKNESRRQKESIRKCSVVTSSSDTTPRVTHWSRTAALLENFSKGRKRSSKSDQPDCSDFHPMLSTREHYRAKTPSRSKTQILLDNSCNGIRSQLKNSDDSSNDSTIFSFDEFSTESDGKKFLVPTPIGALQRLRLRLTTSPQNKFALSQNKQHAAQVDETLTRKGIGVFPYIHGRKREKQQDERVRTDASVHRNSCPSPTQKTKHVTFDKVQDQSGDYVKPPEGRQQPCDKVPNPFAKSNETYHNCGDGVNGEKKKNNGNCRNCQACPKDASSSRFLARKLFQNFFQRERVNSALSKSCQYKVAPPMGAAMRKQCCGGRDDGDVKTKARDKLEEQGWNFLQGDAVASDLTLFNEAHSNNDIPALVKLLDSQQAFERNETQIHPWAARPESICSLSAFQLAQMASKEAQLPCKDAIREAGGIKRLVDLLKSVQIDRQQAAMVAISFLSVENDGNCIELFECGAMPVLIKFLTDPVEGMQGACAHTLRNIFVIDVLYRRKFVADGGITGLVSMLDLKDKYDPTQLFNQSEAIFHIEDLILESGAELTQFVAAVKNAGVAKKLELLTKVDNEQVNQDARELLIRFID